MCYAMVVATVLDYHRCKKLQITDCSKSGDEVSVLDLAKQTFNGKTLDYASAYALLSFTTEPRRIARERCAPYSNLMGGRKDILNSNFFDELKATSRIINAKSSMDTNECNILSRASSLYGISFQHLFRKLGENTLAEFLNSITVPLVCEKDTIEFSIVAESLANLEFPRSHSDFAAFIDKRVDRKTPVLWRLCSNLPLSSVCSSNAAHSVIVFGTRERCCPASTSHPKCQREYLVRDTANVIGPLTKQGTGPGDYWVSEDFVQERAEAILRADERDGFTLGNLMWIEDYR